MPPESTPEPRELPDFFYNDPFPTVSRAIEREAQLKYASLYKDTDYLDPTTRKARAGEIIDLYFPNAVDPWHYRIYQLRLTILLCMAYGSPHKGIKKHPGKFNEPYYFPKTPKKKGRGTVFSSNIPNVNPAIMEILNIVHTANPTSHLPTPSPTPAHPQPQPTTVNNTTPPSPSPDISNDDDVAIPDAPPMTPPPSSPPPPPEAVTPSAKRLLTQLREMADELDSITEEIEKSDLVAEKKARLMPLTRSIATQLREAEVVVMV